MCVVASVGDCAGVGVMFIDQAVWRLGAEPVLRLTLTPVNMLLPTFLPVTRGNYPAVLCPCADRCV